MPARIARLGSALAAWFAIVSAGVVSAGIVSAGPAAAANLLELNFYLSGPRYDGVLPPCDASDALGKISARFSEKEGSF